MVVKHPVYANKVIATLEVTGPLAVVSVRPSAITAAEAPRTARSESIALGADPAASKIKVKEIAEGATGKIDLGDAPIIISGGRGLKVGGELQARRGSRRGVRQRGRRRDARRDG